jgi:2-amino-4-hydroxy-6-hydroxymethyldihydropteridine diphosphokinase
MHERAFVLIPLRDIAPDWRHPIIGKTIREMAGELTETEKQSVERLVFEQ